MKPLVFDLFCGLGGWSEAFIKEGYRAVGFDIEQHDYGTGAYPGELVLRDVRSIAGSELVKTSGVPTCIVASPPCQEFSYMAMPWSKAKEKMRKILAEPAEQERLTDLFNQCFRIQREVSAAAGYYVPMIVENVRGAQRWVGRARWNFGSFYLWGDVPALMPIPGKFRKTPEGGWDTTRENYNQNHSWNGNKMGDSPGKVWSERPPSTAAHREMTRKEGNKTAGMNWSDPETRGKNVHGVPGRQRGVSFTDAAGWAALQKEGIKQFKDFHDSPIAALGSKCPARKRASAEIAKIPPALAQWIARTFKQPSTR